MTQTLSSLATLTALFALAACGEPADPSDSHHSSSDHDSHHSSDAHTTEEPLPSDPVELEPASVDCETGTWDLQIGFRGRSFTLRTNSGDTGDGEGGVAGPWPWEEVATLNSPDKTPDDETVRFTVDRSRSLIDEWPWYAYGVDPSGPGGPHTLSPNFRVYLVDTDSTDPESPLFAVQIIDYYDSAGTSANYTIRFREAGSHEVHLLEVDATSSSTWAGVDLVERTVRSSTDEGSWHIAFQRVAVRSNGGDSGAGSVTLGLSVAQEHFYDDDGQPLAEVFIEATAESELEALTGELPAPPRGLDEVSDRISSGFGDAWARYDFSDGNYYANDDVGWLLRGADGESFAKVRFSDLDFPTREGQGIKSFTFDFHVWGPGASDFEGPFLFEGSIPSSGGERCFDMVGR